jgi:hypothetical protein
MSDRIFSVFRGIARLYAMVDCGLLKVFQQSTFHNPQSKKETFRRGWGRFLVVS